MLLLHGHRAPLERGPKAGGGYKHLAAPRPIHNYTTTRPYAASEVYRLTASVRRS